jgi:UDP-N-acetylmuramoylalanine--D-glutamate ligase
MTRAPGCWFDVAERVNHERIDALLVGFGLANRAVATALVGRGHTVVATDDHPDASVVAAAAESEVELVTKPTTANLVALVERADIIFPTPGLPDSHPALLAADAGGVATAGEFDLARAWDSRPLLAVTGTNGKTTVVELCVAALNASGVLAAAAGNTDVPLVTAIDDEHVEMFVVEASSFRLGHAQRFSPRVGTWINFAPDHLDVHRDLASYEKAKASIWANLDDDGAAGANIDDPAVMRNVPSDRSVHTFGGPGADWRVETGRLVGPDGDIMAVTDMWRSMPHDVEDALAAAATVAPVGASPAGLAAAYREFDMSAHRVQLVGEIDGTRFYDDSKATTPHATVAALRSFDRVVLIAGGRNKGVSLAAMREAVDRVQAVVAIGESAPEIVAVFESRREVRQAADMDEAVAMAVDLASAGSVVLLSPGCASFDWYRGYGERGDDFTRAVRDRGGQRAAKGEP